MDDWFRVDVTRSDEGAYLALVGELDAAVAPQLAARIEALAAEQTQGELAFGGDGEAGLSGNDTANDSDSDNQSTQQDDAGGGRRVVIDLSRLTFIDSTGAEVIRAADERSIEVMSAGHPCREVRRVFEVVGLEHLVDGG